MSIPENDNSKIPLRFHIKLPLSFLLHPREGFRNISEHYPRSWITPMLIISLTSVLFLVAAGWLKQQSALMEIPNLPEDFDYFSPEQQAQYFQASQATQGTAFIYILPIIGSLLGIWMGWLITGGLLHLATTLFGGRGNTSVSMNLVAWSSLPMAIRNIVRLFYIVFSHKLIVSSGLSGFVTMGDSNWSLILAAILGMIDIYLIWYIILLIVGVRVTAGISVRKSIGSVLLVMVLILGLQAATQFLISKLGNLSITRPFFF